MTEPIDIPPSGQRQELRCDVAVVGGGTAGTMAAITAAEMGASVLLLDKAHVRHSGALAMGMDGVNNAVIPGKATPEDYVAEITRANEGIINQRTVYQTASRGYDMVRRLEQYGVKFAKDAHGDYDVRRVHRSGSYVLPMPEGKDIKKVLYRVLRQRSIRERVRIENRVMPVRVLTAAGCAVGVAGFNTRTGEFVTASAGAVILATGACGRLGLPASGYLYGTYENPTNAGDGHAMAYHAGAELSGLECFQINPLIKDYNGPACAYVANPFGGYQVNHRGERFVDCDYWSGQMMAEVAREIASARGPIYLKLTHLPEETISALEGILHTTERPTRGTFHAGRGHDYRTHDVEMHISEIGLCGGHSSSGVWVDENAATTVPGLYAAGDLACVPHNYMIGAFVFGDLAGAHASEFARGAGAAGPAGPDPAPGLPEDQIGAAHELIYRPLRNPDGPPQAQVEYKLRRFVNDYLAPPKTQARLDIALETFGRMTTEIAQMGARTPHELMRCAEVTFIRDCAELAARASLARTESRWGLYHDRADHPGRDDAEWFWHLNIRRGADGSPELLKRPVGSYIVPVSEFEVPVREPGEVVLIPRLPGPGRGRLGRYRLAPAAAAASVQPADILQLLRLTDAQPSVPQLEPYLADSDARVRRAAIAALTETAPPGAGRALAHAAGDDNGTVRHAAVAGLRELVAILPADDEALLDSLRLRLGSPDPVVRSAVLDLLREMRVAEVGPFAAALSDADHRVRLRAVSGLVFTRQARLVAAAAADRSREVRVAVADGLAALAAELAETGPADGREALERLAHDPDVLVQAAAFKAAGALGCPPPLDILAARMLRRTAAAWEVRAGAARALAAASPVVAVGPLVAAVSDPHANVRKAAVTALAPMRAYPGAVEALHAAACDGDADVRAYARHAIDGGRRLPAAVMNDLAGRATVGIGDGPQRPARRVAHAEEEGDIVIAGRAQDLTGRTLVADRGMAGADAEVGGLVPDGPALAGLLLREALLRLFVEVGRQGPLLGCRDVGGQVRRVRGADDGGRQARVAEGEAEDELHGGHARVSEQVLDARGLPVPLAEARLLGKRAGPPVLVLRRRATGRAASDQRSRALARRLGDEVLVVALYGRVGDLEGVEDVHREVVGQVREDA
jgi:succinate dehydrogenase/fumarate reductase flavoprotein subunit/HEAT repeat protein